MSNHLSLSPSSHEWIHRASYNKCFRLYYDTNGANDFFMQDIDIESSNRTLGHATRIKNHEATLKKIASVMVDAAQNTGSTRCLMADEALQGNADLVEIFKTEDIKSFRRSLENLLRHGAYLYVAMEAGHIVGTSCIVRLLHSCPASPPQVREKERLEATAQRGVDGYREALYRYNIQRALNFHLEKYGTGNIWEFSGLCVLEPYRGQGIGSLLATLALRDVPSNAAVILQAEMDKYDMYASKFGFQLTSQPEHQYNRSSWAQQLLSPHLEGLAEVFLTGCDTFSEAGKGEVLSAIATYTAVGPDAGVNVEVIFDGRSGTEGFSLPKFTVLALLSAGDNFSVTVGLPLDDQP
ncbi:hypothetical protein F5Y16DRAFT_397460 [Xylariaceae sp. FL0255]|nr:hypothetical protein F5Y16DRAFT_397460 [Xylariaceae sp. FL0255]